MRIGLIGAVIGMSAGVGLGGAEAAEANAALAYYRAWAIMDQDLAGTLVTGDALSLRAGAEAELRAAGGVVEDLVEASAMDGVDWEIKYEEGFAALMPHLGKMRAGAKVVAADALRCAGDGDGAGAAERAASLFRMTRHLNDDRILISSLVAMAIGNMGTELTGQLIDDGVLDAGGARVILDAIRAGDAEDRFGMRGAIVGEWRLMSEFLVSNAPEEGAGRWLFTQAQIAEDSAAAKKVARMDRDALLRELGGFAAYHGELLAAWDAQDADRLDACEQRLIAGAFGPLPELLAPSVTRAYASHVKSMAQYDALIERLEEIAG